LTPVFPDNMSFLVFFSSFSLGTARPPYWHKAVYLLDEEDEKNNGYINDDFIIWMRVSAFATFRNLYRRISRKGQFTDGLPAGNYTFHISYSILSYYPRRSLTTSWLQCDSSGWDLYSKMAKT